jgi:hypothetical protein
MLSLSGSRRSAAGTLAWKDSSFFVAVADGAACATAIRAASKPAATAANAAGTAFGCLCRKTVAKARPTCARTSMQSRRRILVRNRASARRRGADVDAGTTRQRATEKIRLSRARDR